MRLLHACSTTEVNCNTNCACCECGVSTKNTRSSCFLSIFCRVIQTYPGTHRPREGLTGRALCQLLRLSGGVSVGRGPLPCRISTTLQNWKLGLACCHRVM